MSLTTDKQRKCPQCSSLYEAGDRFCSSCGHKFAAVEREPVTAPEPTTKPVKTQKKTRRLKPVGRKSRTDLETLSGAGQTTVTPRTVRRPLPTRSEQAPDEQSGQSAIRNVKLANNGQGQSEQPRTAPSPAVVNGAKNDGQKNDGQNVPGNGAPAAGLVEKPVASAAKDGNVSDHSGVLNRANIVEISSSRKTPTDDVAVLPADVNVAADPALTSEAESAESGSAVMPQNVSGPAPERGELPRVTPGNSMTNSAAVVERMDDQPASGETAVAATGANDLDLAEELFDMLESGPQNVASDDEEFVVDQSEASPAAPPSESEEHRLARMSDVWVVSEAVAAERDAAAAGERVFDDLPSASALLRAPEIPEADRIAAMEADVNIAAGQPDERSPVAESSSSTQSGVYEGPSLEDFVIAGPESDHPVDIQLGQATKQKPVPQPNADMPPVGSVQPPPQQPQQAPVRPPAPASQTAAPAPAASAPAAAPGVPTVPAAAASAPVSPAVSAAASANPPLAPNAYPATAPMATPAQPMPMMPNVIHVPVPVPTAMPAEPAAESIDETSRPEIPVKLPEAGSVGVPESELNREEDEELKLESDSQSGLGEEQLASLKHARQRLQKFVTSARKDLFLVQENPTDELPRKIRKLVDELGSARDLKATTHVIRRLGSTRMAAIVSPLQEFVKGGAAASEPMKLAVVEAVSQVPDPASSQFLLTLLNDPVTSVVEESIRRLVQLRRDEVLLPLIAVALVRSSNRTVLQEALLSETSSVQLEAVDRLKKLLNHRDEEVVVVAVDLISKLHSEGHFKLFTRLIDRESSAVRGAALEAMVRTGEKQTVRFLNKAMKDQSPVVRASAANGLGQIHSPKSSVLLMGGLLDEDVKVRRSCAKSLTLIDDERIPKGVALALKKETDPATIEYLLQGLGQTGSPAALETLSRYLKSGDKEMCHRAMATLRKLRERKSAKMVLPFLADEHVDTRRQAAETLGLLREPKAASRLREVLKTDAASEVRASAARALGELADNASTSALEEALYDDRAVKVQAIIALGRLQAQSSIPAIMAQLRDAGADVRYHACSALGQMQSIPNPERLQEMLDDRDPMVQRGAKAALEKLGVSYRKGQFVSRLKKIGASLIPSGLAGGIPVGGTLIALVVISVLSYGGYTLLSGGLSTLTGPSFRISQVEHAALSPDGKQLGISRKFRVFETWNLETGELANRLEMKDITSGLQFSDPQTLLRFTSAGAQKLTSFQDVTLESFEADSGLKSLSTYIVETTTDGAYAAFCGFAGEVQIVDLKTRQPRGKSFKMKEFVKGSSLAITNDASLILVGAPTGDVIVYQAATGEMVGRVSLSQILKKPKISLTSMALDPASTLLAAGTRSGEIVIIDLNAGLKIVGIPRKEGTSIVKLRFKGRECVFVTTDAVIGLCDASFKSSSTLKTKLPERPDTVQFSLDGQIAVATFSESKEFVVFNVEEDRMMLESDGKE